MRLQHRLAVAVNHVHHGAGCRQTRPDRPASRWARAAPPAAPPAGAAANCPSCRRAARDVAGVPAECNRALTAGSSGPSPPGRGPFPAQLLGGKGLLEEKVRPSALAWASCSAVHSKLRKPRCTRHCALEPLSQRHAGQRRLAEPVRHQQGRAQSRPWARALSGSLQQMMESAAKPWLSKSWRLKDCTPASASTTRNFKLSVLTSVTVVASWAHVLSR